ncbi:MAG: hypothetical protein H0X64_12945 [Gemmatimonadaceae bacterium]|nr:hypothetical protein [Gemmatimonadaceae bacterium]
MAIASPISSTNYNLDSRYVLGNTTKYDVFRRNLPPTDFLQIPTELTTERDKKYGMVLPLAELEAHDVVQNYVVDAHGSVIVASTINEMLNRCRMLEQ